MIFIENIPYTELKVKAHGRGAALSKPGLANVRIAGHIRPAKHLHVARELRLKFSY